ncbi:ankyrin repeat domain-containing protein [Candidatus Babeliales bacterium]|nr:ankyrin repeat domain-containing protein [Candidatus Babeliales bacterium]
MIKKFMFLLFISLSLANTALPAATTSHNAQLSLKQDSILSRFLDAAKYNESKKIKIYIQFLKAENISIDRLGKFGESALHIAAENGHTEMVKILLDAGASPEALTREGLTPLHYAANCAIMQLLLDRHVNIEAVDKHGKTPLHCAALRGRVECLQLLLNNNANPNVLTTLQQTPLHFAAARKDGAECVTKLLAAGADKDLQDFSGKTTFEIAAWHQHKLVMRALR